MPGEPESTHDPATAKATDALGMRSFCLTFVKNLRLFLGAVAVIYAAFLIWFFAKDQLLCVDPAWHLLVWTLAPPLWFAFEYWAMSNQPERNNGSLKEGQEVAGKIWGAVLVVLLYFYPNGPLHEMTRMKAPLAERSSSSLQSPNVAAPVGQKAPLEKPVQSSAGESVHIVSNGCPGEGGCDFKIWTTKKPTTLWEKPSENSPVIARLPAASRVKGIAAQTITTHLPLCTFTKDNDAWPTDCVGPSCKPAKLRAGDAFLILEYQGEGSIIIRRGQQEMQIWEQGVDMGGGKQEYGISNYKCQGELKAKTWVKVELPNGTTGWSNRENFNGTSQYD